MKSGLIILTIAAALSGSVTDAYAQPRKPKPRAAPQRLVREPCKLSWTELFWPSCSVGPYATGAAPAVYVGHSYAGQDPDPNIRAQLRREFGRDWP
jgi:hypothetical protein